MRKGPDPLSGCVREELDKERRGLDKVLPDPGLAVSYALTSCPSSRTSLAQFHARAPSLRAAHPANNSLAFQSREEVLLFFPVMKGICERVNEFEEL